MLHDLFLALVGLCGDLIVEGEDRFFVRPGLTILSVGEIEQLDNIAPLGWFYKKLLSFVHLYEVQWSPSGNKNNRFEAYIASMSAGVSTVLSDYENDVTTLEQLVAIEPIPLCQVYQHMQKYLMILPSIYNMCVEATVTRSLSGCQLLTFIGHYQSGIPAVAEAIERILSRVQSVMYRQTMAWILYGRLDDSAGEFFVKYRDTDASQTVGIRHQSWNRSFTLKLDCIPESHLSAVQASKILFAGKTACLLNQTLFATSKSLPGKSNTGIRSKRHSNEVYQYLCSNHFEGNQKSHTSFANAESISPRSFPPETHNHTQSKNNLDHSSSGLVPSFLAEKDLISFAQSFQQILHSSAASSVVLFNDLVDRIHRSSSNVLWTVLMQEHDIISFFHVIRNVYLLGKGEFYQVILDNLLSLTQAPAPESAAVDSLLKWRVLRASAKTLNLDDESLDTFLDLTSSSAGVTLTDFHCQSGLVHMTGDCVIEFMEPAVDKRDSSPKSSRLSFVAMCKVTDHKNIESRQATQWNREIFDLSIKSTHISPHDNSAWTEPALSVDKKLTELSRDSVHGCLSLEDEQVLGKGFFFHCLLRRCLSSSGKLAFMGDERRGDLVNQVSICFSREKLVLGQIFKDSSSYPASVVVRLQFYVRAQRQVGSDSFSLFHSVSVAVIGFEYSTSAGLSSDSKVLSEMDFPLDGSFNNLDCDDNFSVEIEYLKVRESDLQSANAASVASASSTVSRSRFTTAMRIRLGKPGTTTTDWCLTLPLDLDAFVSRQSVGRVSIVSHSRVTSSAQSSAVIELYQLSFQQRLSLEATTPLVSAYTQAHHSDTTAALLEEIGRFQAWMNLSLRVDMPPIFCVLFDDEVLGVYETLFSNLIKIRLVAHALERIWQSRSRLGSDRQFNHVRQSMHYFVSNLLYYLQIDVVDSEFCQLMDDGIRSAQEFQQVYKLHKRFLGTVCRLSFVDNTIVKESIEKILTSCVRFIALCRLKLRQESDMLSYQSRVTSRSKLQGGIKSVSSNDTALPSLPLIIPAQELKSIKSDFMSQIGYLFKAVSSLDDQKFLYRLDFNGYFSKQFI